MKSLYIEKKKYNFKYILYLFLFKFIYIYENGRRGSRYLNLKSYYGYYSIIITTQKLRKLNNNYNLPHHFLKFNSFSISTGFIWNPNV